ncbi:hypothetical protein ABL840_25430 [Variovorax sp. NFACC27]|uniref:hypothetical protein n=1 Tax=unclassified Variovorax TaxID=663243 RepID=UPI00089AFFC2|nr:hypothetical protein SAMN03159371_07671 [Variovorax sp. NFACC28]SEG99372.1 hypothetical protein SAMN03159365_07620 [Variovorax sp. NFACC29]SFE23697.1 hypothetical protein SAMN03159379_07618 [Variovorax sp. NFACC26]SFH27859.1 hypothetical protein SAMN03159447_07625 [Variovorax sp. NFACC27]
MSDDLDVPALPLFEVDGLVAQAIARACEDAKSLGLPFENYKLVLVEQSNAYNVSWEAKGKPQGHRGALPGLVEASLLIEKSSGRLLQKHLSR